MITEKADSFLFMSCKILLYGANSGNLQTDWIGLFKKNLKEKVSCRNLFLFCFRRQSENHFIFKNS